MENSNITTLFEYVDIKFIDVLQNVWHLLVIPPVTSISAPNAEKNIIEVMLLVKCSTELYNKTTCKILKLEVITLILQFSIIFLKFSFDTHIKEGSLKIFSFLNSSSGRQISLQLLANYPQLLIALRSSINQKAVKSPCSFHIKFFYLTNLSISFIVE